jgi:hypothetical protein
MVEAGRQRPSNLRSSAGYASSPRCAINMRVNMQKKVVLFVDGVPLSLKQRLAVRAEEQGTNSRSLAVQLVCRRLGVPYKPGAARRSGGIGGSDKLTLLLPQRAHQRLLEQRARTRMPMREIVLAILDEDLDDGIAA